MREGDEHVKLDGEAGNEAVAAVVVVAGNKGFRDWRIVANGFSTTIRTEPHVYLAETDSATGGLGCPRSYRCSVDV
jgi:hypothetical protein